MEFQAFTIQKYPEWSCVQVKAPESTARIPVHLCCVIDTSGSMDFDNKLENVKRSLHYLLDFLEPVDSISLVTFSDAARVIVNNVNITADEKENIRSLISNIRPEANTNLSAGIIQSRDTLTADTTTKKQSILLLTDGMANFGLTLSEDIIDVVRGVITKFGVGTSMSCIGYGTDHNVSLLQEMSSEGGGSYNVVKNLDDVATVFGDVLGGLVSCVSQQVSVILPTGTEVKSKYAVHDNADKMEVVIGDLSAGTEAVFLAKLPVGQQITLQGYNLETHNNFNIDIKVSNILDVNFQSEGEAHYLRFDVMKLLEESQKFLMFSGTVIDMNKHIEKISVCIEKIKTSITQNNNPLLAVLLSELENCKYSLENRSLDNFNDSHIMSQHVDYLGRMRGVPASLSQPIMIDDLSQLPDNTLLLRAFSNPTQREISAQLYANVSHIQSESTITISSPITNSVMNSVTNSIQYSNLSQFDSYDYDYDSNNLPLPPWNISRQLACNSLTRSISIMPSTNLM